MNKLKLTKHTVVSTAILCLFGFAFLWLMITVVIPILLDGGLKQYSGARLEAARDALSIAESRYDNKLRWAYHFHIDDVRPVTTDEIAQVCHNPAYITQNTNNPAYYTVVLSQSQLFVFGTKTEAQVGCHSDKFLYY